MAETELDRAQKRYEQAKARLQALRNRALSDDLTGALSRRGSGRR